MDAFVVDSVRTPIGNLGGLLSTVRPDDLAAHVIGSVLQKCPSSLGIQVEDVILGCANQAGEDNRNVARMAALLAGLPVTSGGETVNRLCASGLAAVANAARALSSGAGDLYIAGGVESMTRAPWVISKSSQAFGRDAQMFDSAFGWRFVNSKMKDMYGIDAMGETAENLAIIYNISREDQDWFSLKSQQKTATAKKNGYLAQEIVPVPISNRKGAVTWVSEDEFPRPGSTAEGLAALRPAFKKDGTVTAGNSSGLNDGACAIIMANAHGLKTHNLKPKAVILSAAVAGTEPRVMGIGPVEASKKALSRAGLRLDQMDVIELNEAFAAQVLACARLMELSDDDPRLNPNGGAISLGHPLGMSGSRLMQTAVNELQRSKGRYALVTMCIGVGQGYAVVLERVD